MRARARARDPNECRLLAYLIGRFVEYEWGSYPSLVVFLALYFLSLWVAWLFSLWVTEPKKAAA
jgi:hypothetical protein